MDPRSINYSEIQLALQDITRITTSEHNHVEELFRSKFTSTVSFLSSQDNEGRSNKFDRTCIIFHTNNNNYVQFNVHKQ